MKKKAQQRRKQIQSKPGSRGGRKAAVILGLVLSLGLTGIIYAQMRIHSSINSHLAASPIPQDTPVDNPETKILKPTKEYIYAGGRLVATEEPSAPTSSPTPTQSGSPTATPTPPPGGAQSLALNGAGAYVQVNDSTTDPNKSLDLDGGPVTLEAWVKFNSTTVAQTVIAKEDHGQTTGGGGYELAITAAGKLRLNIWTDYNTYYSTIGATTVSAGVWHHVAAVVDGTANRRRIYLDGQLDASVSGSQMPAASLSAFTIGRRPNGTSYLGGLVDEVRVSKAALYTADFVPQVSLTSTTGMTKGLWKFDGQAITDPYVNDGSGLGNHGQLSGAAYSSDVVQAARYSLSLNGADAYVTVPSTSSLSLTGPVTLEAWVKFDTTSAYQTIIAKEEHAQMGGGGGYELAILSTGKVRFNIWTDYNTYSSVTSYDPVLPGGWRHIAAVADSNGRRIYVDGAEQGNVTVGVLPTAGGSAFTIGRRPNNTYPLDGLVDEVRVSNAALYTVPFGPQSAIPADLFKQPSTVGLWRFNQRTAEDTSGLGNHGQLQGGTAFSTDVK